MNQLEGFVLFIPPAVIRGRKRILPNHLTMDPGTAYGVRCDFGALERWAIKGQRRYPSRAYGFKQIASNSYLVGFIVKGEQTA